MRQTVIAVVTISAACAPSPHPRTAVPDQLIERLVGDYVHPRFSPNGTHLAFAEVLKDTTGFETTQVIVANLHSGLIDTILGQAAARKYGTYAAFVGHLEWMSSRHVSAHIRDGDVGTTVVGLDVTSGEVLEETFVDGGIEAISPALARVVARLESLYPEVRPAANFPWSVFQGALNRAVFIDSTGVVLQINHAGFDHNVRYYSLTERDSRVVVEVEDEYLHSFGGGVAVGSDVAFAVTRGGTATMYVWSPNQVEPAVPVETVTTSLQAAWVSLRRTNTDEAFFLLRTGAMYAVIDNPAFGFRSGRLTRLVPQGLVHDYDIDIVTGQMALVEWRDGRRALSVSSR